MLSFNLKFNILNIDIDKYSQHMDNHLQQKIRQAAREFIRATFPLVPVWSGMARASLLPLANILHVYMPISPVIDVPNRVLEGVALAITDYFQKTKFGYIFKVGTNVKHYNINEQMNVNPFGFHLKHPGPWNSFDAGEAAAKKYLKENLSKNCPKVFDFIKVKSIIKHTPKLE